MSAFLVIRKTLPGFEDLVKRGTEQYAAIGLALSHRFDSRHSCTLIFSPQYKPPTILNIENGDFLYSSGTFFFNGCCGLAALEEFHRDVGDGLPSVDGCRGHFTLVLSRGGRLQVVGDGLGVATVFMNRDRTAFGSSFIAVSAVSGRLSLSQQNVYEYVFNGSVLGNGTLFDQVEILPMNARLTIDEDGVHMERPPVVVPDPSRLGREALIERSLEHLRHNFRTFTAAFGGNVICALSGGYDSRLIVGLLRELGVQPDLFVYGRPKDDDVVIAKSIAAGEGMSLLHVDKSSAPPIPPHAYAAQVRRNLFQSDGYTWGGLFSGDAEHIEQQRRSAGGRLHLNGGGGEVFRNFFYLPEGRFSVRELLWTFYSPFDPGWCTTSFCHRAYYRRLEEKVLDLLGRDAAAGDGTRKLYRHEIEWLYPTFRCRSWVAREVQLGNWWGSRINPFLEPSLVELTTGIPLAMKGMGQFEAELIRRVSPKLASYPSAYGYDFSGQPPLSSRVKSRINQSRPPWLRKMSFRIRHRLQKGRPFQTELYTSPAYVEAVLGKEPLEMRRLFKLDRIRDPAQWNRILSVEYIARTVGRGMVFA